MDSKDSEDSEDAVDSEDSTGDDSSSDVLLTSFSKVRIMSTSRRMTTRPTNAPKAAASKGNGNSDVEAASPVNVTETVPEAKIPTCDDREAPTLNPGGDNYVPTLAPSPRNSQGSP